MTPTREQIIDAYSDLFKSAYGFRPRHQYDELRTWSDARMQEEFLRVQQASADAAELERVQQAQAVQDFETHIASLQRTHGIDRATAIRWDRQAEGCDRLDDGYCYKKGLPFGYFKR